MNRRRFFQGIAAAALSAAARVYAPRTLDTTRYAEQLQKNRVTLLEWMAANECPNPWVDIVEHFTVQGVDLVVTGVGLRADDAQSNTRLEIVEPEECEVAKPRARLGRTTWSLRDGVREG